jgi:Glycoside-hydrolase family GH114
MRARFQMCKHKHFDGVEADNVDGYTNSTGFALSGSDQLTYNKWLARTSVTVSAIHDSQGRVVGASTHSPPGASVLAQRQARVRAGATVVQQRPDRLVRTDDLAAANDSSDQYRRHDLEVEALAPRRAQRPLRCAARHSHCWPRMHAARVVITSWIAASSAASSSPRLAGACNLVANDRVEGEVCSNLEPAPAPG